MDTIMRKALLIDCCIRKSESRTAQLLEAFAGALPGDVNQERLILDEENLSCLTGSYFEQRQRLLENGLLDHPRFRYAHQFAEADIVCIAAPFWDLSFPALLKVYIEQIGLCRGTDLVFLTTRGGVYTDNPMEMGSRYLDALHTFFGFERYHCIAADGMDMSRFDTSEVLDAAKQRIRNLAGKI